MVLLPTPPLPLVIAQETARGASGSLEEAIEAPVE